MINLLGSCEAPPIKKPSIILIFLNCEMFWSLTDPPYKIFGGFEPNLLLIKLTDLIKSLDFGIIPVPIDQNGS